MVVQTGNLGSANGTQLRNALCKGTDGEQGFHFAGAGGLSGSVLLCESIDLSDLLSKIKSKGIFDLFGMLKEKSKPWALERTSKKRTPRGIEKQGPQLMGP